TVTAMATVTGLVTVLTHRQVLSVNCGTTPYSDRPLPGRGGWLCGVYERARGVSAATQARVQGRACRRPLFGPWRKAPLPAAPHSAAPRRPPRARHEIMIASL